MGVNLRFDVACDPESLAHAARIIATLRAMTSPGIDLTAGWTAGPPSPAHLGVWAEGTVNSVSASTPGPGLVEPNANPHAADTGPNPDCFSPSPSMGEGGGGGDGDAKALTPPATADAADRVGAWLAHLGLGARAFWRAAARYAVDHPEFTFADLEAASGITRGTLRSRYQSSYRAIRGENSPDPMPGRQDAKTRRFVYSMSPAVRDRILELTAGDLG
jgi:hypothetical protein